MEGRVIQTGGGPNKIPTVHRLLKQVLYIVPFHVQTSW